MIENLPRELQEEIQKYMREEYPSIGGTPAYRGTYLEWLDRPLRLDIRRYLTRCPFQIQTSRYGHWRVDIDIKGVDEWTFSSAFVTSAHILDFLRRIDRGEYARLQIWSDSVLFYSNVDGTISRKGVSVPYCSELHEALILTAEHYKGLEKTLAARERAKRKEG